MNIILHKKNENIIDRYEEIKYIKEQMLNANKSKVFIIHANTGIGKSSVLKKFMFQKDLNDYTYFPTYFRIETLPNNKNNKVSEWLYIDEIFNVIQSYYEENPYAEFLRFDYYLINNKNELIKNLVKDEMFSDISNNSIGNISLISSLKTVVEKNALKKLLRVGYYNPYSFIHNFSSASKCVKTEYIRYVLSNVKCIISIDNLQNIDNTSFKYIIDWINDTKNQKNGFIFEYTTTDDYSIEYLNSITHRIMETNVSVYTLGLKAIEERYILDIVNVNIEKKSKNLAFDMDTLDYFSHHSKGNIWNVINYARTYETTRKSDVAYIDPTLTLFQEVKEDAKIICYIVFYFDGRINYDELVYVFNNHFQSDKLRSLDEILTDLFDRDILRLNKDYIVFSHASNLDIVKNSIPLYQGIDYIVYNRLTDLFMEQYKGSVSYNSKENAWYRLLRLFVDHETDRISEMLNDFIKNTMTTISQKNAWSYLKAFIINTQHKINDFKNLYYYILEICYKTFLYEEGLWCIEIMEKHINTHNKDLLLLHKLLYYSILDKQTEVIEIYKSRIRTVAPYSRMWINLKLIVLNCYIATNRKDLCLEIHKDLITTPKFNTYPEYPIFLRLTNIYLPYKKALHNVKKSIKIFSKISDLEQEGKSWITYSKLLSSIGKHKKAIKAIKNAELKLSKSNIEYACIYNNLAGYLLLDGKYGPEVWNYLDFAEQYSVTVYDKLSILLNKMAWCYENNAFDRIDLLENKANYYISLEPDKLIHCTTYYNLFLIMNKANDKEKSEYYYKKSYDLKEFCPYIKARIDGINFKNHYLVKRIIKPYHICYLSFWIYDLKWDDFSENTLSS